MSATADERRLRRDLGWNLAPVVLLAGVGLGLNLLIGVWWGEAALGSFNLVTIAVFSFAVLGAWGLQYAVLRAVAEHAGDRDRVAAVVVGALIPGVALSAATTALFLILRAPIGQLQGAAVAEGMAWAAPGLFCFAINKLLLGVVNGLRRMRAFAIYTSLRYLLIAAGLGLARAWQLDAVQLPVIWSFTEGVLLVVLLGELLATVALRRAAGWRVEARRHLGFGARGVAATLAYEVNSKLDVWVLGAVAPAAQVGIYSMASALYEGVTQLAVVLQNNVNPVLARQLAEDRPREVEQLVRRTRRWFVPVLVAACAIGAASYPFVVPWVIGNPAFADGAGPFAIMMIGIVLASPYLPFNQLLLMAARPGWHTGYMVAIVGVNLAGTLALIPAFGSTGAAVSTAVALAGSAALLRTLVRWRVGVRI